MYFLLNRFVLVCYIVLNSLDIGMQRRVIHEYLLLFGLYICVFCQMMVPARESVLLNNWHVGCLNVWYAVTESGNMILYGVVPTATMCCIWNVLRSGLSLQRQVGILYIKEKQLFVIMMCVVFPAAEDAVLFSVRCQWCSRFLFSNGILDKIRV